MIGTKNLKIANYDLNFFVGIRLLFFLKDFVGLKLNVFITAVDLSTALEVTFLPTVETLE